MLAGAAPNFGYNYGYNSNPSFQAGNGAYGKVPGPIGVPPSQWSEALAAVPGLGGNANTASSAIQSMLQGQLTPDEIAQDQQHAAAAGVSSGVPNSPFNTADLIRSLDLNSHQLVQQGLGDFNSLAGTVGGMQLNPSLLTDIAERNALYAAAPDPQAAAQELHRLYEEGIGEGNPAGKTGGWGSTNILGPKTTYGGGPGIGGSPFGGSASPFDQSAAGTGVFTGGPGFNTAGADATTSNPWQDYMQRTFGYQLGNPSGDTGNNVAGDPFSDWGWNYLMGGASLDQMPYS